MRFLKRIINHIIYAVRCFWYFVNLGALHIRMSIKWSAWNPWAIARLNLAWTKYTETTMYEERFKCSEFHTDPNRESYAEQAYIENCEVMFFVNQFTWKDKLKIAFTPFSCGNQNRMPFYIISAWLRGDY